MNRWLCALIVVCVPLLTAGHLSGISHRQAPRVVQNQAPGHLPEDEFLLHGAYYNVSDYSVTLMLNNKGPEALMVETSIFSPKGEHLFLKGISVAGHSFVEVDLEEILGDAPGKFRRGTLELRYFGHFLQLGGQLRHFDARRRLGFEEQLSRPEEFKSSTLRGNWSVRDTGSRLLFVFSNVSSSPLAARIGMSGVRATKHFERLNLDAHETQVIEAQPAGASGRLEVIHEGRAGDLLARGIILGERSGFASSVDFSDPARSVLSELHGSGLRLSSKDTLLLSLANHGDQDSRISLGVMVSQGGASRKVSLPEFSLRHGEVREMGEALLDELAEPVRMGDIESDGLWVAYSTAPGTVTGFVQWREAGTGLIHRIPMLAPGAHFSSAGTYPWSLEEGQDTIFHIKNMTRQARTFQWYLRSGGEIVYSGGHVLLGAGQSRSVDIRQLRDSGAPDGQGRTIPPAAERGQVTWSFFGQGVALDGRVERIDPQRGVASTYECAACCNDTFQTSVIPVSVHAGVGDPPVTFIAQRQTTNCYGVPGPIEDVEVTHIWFDGPSGVVSTLFNTLTCLGPGFGTAEVFVPLPFSISPEVPELCPSEPIQPETEEVFFVPILVDPELRITQPTASRIFNITATPTMPGITAKARMVAGNGPYTFNWTYEVEWITAHYGTRKETFTGVTTAINGNETTWPVPFGTKFAGGTGKVTVRVQSGASTLSANKRLDTIKGTQPNRTVVKNFIGPVPWYAQRIGKHETSSINPAGYNQFLPNGTFIESSDGGIGIFQLTPPSSNLQYWSWKENVKGGQAVIASKGAIAADFWASQVMQFNDWNKLNKSNQKQQPPETTYGSETFAFAPSAGQRSYEDAIAIKAFNGAPNGNFISWKNTPPDETNPFWKFNPTNTESPPFNYVERISLTKP